MREFLKSHFEIVFYDCHKLAEIDLSDLSQEKIHQQFTNAGIERAVNALLDNEKKMLMCWVLVLVVL